MLPIFSFEPVFKSVLWGGKRIAEFKGIPSQGDHVGESWELSPMPGHESVVADGPFKGETLPQLLAAHGREIMGEKLYERYGDKFPLLIKFIDSTQDLSIQVHPDDELAAKRHDSLGKTEMWYSVVPAEGAYLYAGFSQEMDADKFRRMVADSTIVDALSKYYTKPGVCTLSGRVTSCLKSRKQATLPTASTTITAVTPRGTCVSYMSTNRSIPSTMRMLHRR